MFSFDNFKSKGRMALIFFFCEKALSLKSVLHIQTKHLRLFLASLQRGEVEELAKNLSEVRNFQTSQTYFLRFFSWNFLFSFDIFKTTSRMTVLFLLFESPDSEEYFTYQVHTYEIYCDLSAAQRSWRVKKTLKK